MVTEVRDLQFWKANQSMVFRSAGSVTLTSAVQLEKALLPINETVSGISSVLREEQFAKALLSISVSPSGSFTYSRFLQLQNALLLMVSTESGIWTLTRY